MFFSSPSPPPSSAAVGQAKPAMMIDPRHIDNNGYLFPKRLVYPPPWAEQGLYHKAGVGEKAAMFPSSPSPPPLSAAMGGRLAIEEWVAVCPEQLAGLSTPRSAARIEDGSGTDVLTGGAQVKTLDGVDVTRAYIRGAEAVLEIARRLDVTVCLLKDRSPSCGINSVQNETDSFQGPGVCAALLIQKGFEVVEIKAKAGVDISN